MKNEKPQTPQRTAQTKSIMQLIENYAPEIAAQDNKPNNKGFYRSITHARFKFAWKNQNGFSKAIPSIDYDGNGTGQQKTNELKSLLDLKEWAEKKIIAKLECYTATIYASLHQDKKLTDKLHNYPLFHWTWNGLQNRYDYQETEVIKWQQTSFDLYWHRRNASTINFKK
jgi:hypothetical protein